MYNNDFVRINFKFLFLNLWVAPKNNSRQLIFTFIHFNNIKSIITGSLSFKNTCNIENGVLKIRTRKSTMCNYEISVSTLHLLHQSCDLKHFGQICMY